MIEQSKQDQLADFFLKTLNDGSDFVKEQAPAVAREVLSYGLIDSVFEIIYALCMAAFCIYMIHLSIKFSEKGNDAVILTIIATVVSGLLFPIMLVCSVDKLLKVEFAPKLFILEQMTGRK